ncbi:TraM recognition domain-containing protein [Agromyces sp. CFH 90414]|uniref:TraM recognition domain-containing protein n=1 Tax=Agromyces agglutinans TaxID=2662258 RepID=A0A6I2F503_9MICO|nr:TraM recognition domain-containing protein [Agromyces agglutinans]MRG58807.1 TraM recognition domain-containing protein [Agromyces agglutinans]
MRTQQASGDLGNELTNVGLAILIGVAGLALMLRVAGSISAWVTGLPEPAVGPEGGLAVILHPSDPAGALGAPGLHPVAFWSAAALLIAAAITGFVLVRRMLRASERARLADPFRMPGIATRADVTYAASRKRLLLRAAHLRPSLEHPEPSDVGYRLGSSQGVEVWASVEDSILVMGPPRSGKGVNIVINAILDAPGPVVTTSTRPDNLAATLTARRQHGPVAVFDPQRLVPGIPAGLRWSPIRGCEDPLTAIIRAKGLAAGTGLSAGGVDGGGFWEAKTRVALQSLLHAAALDRRSPAELFRWTLDPAAAADAAAILHSNTGAATGWGDALQSMLDADPRTRDSIWQGVSLSLASLADPRVLDAVSPTDGERFDPKLFLRAGGTVYLLATSAGADNTANLVAAFIEDLVETGRRIAAESPRARLDPPLLLALDEIGNLAPLPSLPGLMAEGGGTGFTTMPVLQSLAQARSNWSDNTAGTIWDASNVKVMLGGESNAGDLQNIATIIGDRDDLTDATTIGDRGSRSSQRSVRRVQTMPPDTIRTLPDGAGLFLLRSAPPIIAKLRPWTERADAAALQAGRQQVEAVLQAPKPRPPSHGAETDGAGDSDRTDASASADDNDLESAALDADSREVGS